MFTIQSCLSTSLTFEKAADRGSMFVSDSLVFPPSTMKVRITNMEGVDILEDFRPDATVDMVKIRSLSQLFSPMESMKVSLYHKVLLVRTGKVLNEEYTLQQEGLRDNGKNISIVNLCILKLKSIHFFSSFYKITNVLFIFFVLKLKSTLSFYSFFRFHS